MAIEYRSLPELPSTFPLPTPGMPGFEEMCATLFSQPSQIIRAGDRPVIFRNADLRQLAAHPSAGEFSPRMIAEHAFTLVHPDGRKTFAPALSRLIGNQFKMANPPVHQHVRRVLAPRLMPRAVAELEPAAERIAAELAAELAGCTAFDFARAFSARLAACFFGQLIGMTMQEMLESADCMHRLNSMFLRDKTEKELISADLAAEDFIELISRVTDRTLALGDNAIVEQMARELKAIPVKSDPELGGMVPESLGLMLASNLMDGFHTAGVGACNAVYMLLKHPAERAKVEADADMARGAVHEALRLLSPLTITQRYALSEFEYAGVRIPHHTIVIMLWAVGNRDPAVFSDPNTFSVTRSHRLESTFGGGAHLCPGRYVADMIAQVAVRETLRHSWKLGNGNPEAAFAPRSILCQLTALPISVSGIAGSSACPHH
jgi:cytochrome P450